MTYFSEIASRITDSATSNRDVRVRRLTGGSFTPVYSYKYVSTRVDNTCIHARKASGKAQNVRKHARNGSYVAPEYSVFVSVAEACQAGLVGRWENDE